MAGKKISISTISLQLRNQFTVKGSTTLQIRWMSNLGRVNVQHKESPVENKPQVDNDPETSYWVPHPRSGIFYPKGQELVMEDVPSEAASFEQTFWLRNSDVFDQ